MMTFLRQWQRPLEILAACAILFLLWLPGVRIPITSDTTGYALLGESLWRHGSYMLNGVPYAKQLPFHAFVSYPLCWLAGFQLGMKISTLLAGCAVLIATYFLIEHSFSRIVAILSVIFLLLHHGFILMTMLGSADLLFAALFIGSLAAFIRAEDDRRMYLLSGLFLGLASLTRYNGLPLYLLYPAIIFWKRSKDLHSTAFWIGALLALSLPGLWLVRNFVIFGNPLHTTYASEYAQEAPSVIREVVRNIQYYFNPLHNILPVLFLLSIFGLIRFWRTHSILILGMLAGSALAFIWYVQGIRFAFPGYPILLGFAAAGTADLWNRFRAMHRLVILGAIFTLFLHGAALCLYAYGACNGWVDRTINLVPSDLHISSEGLYAISLARDFIDADAPEGAAVLVRSGNAAVWRQGVFRSDLKIVDRLGQACPAYEIEQGDRPTHVLFTTDVSPKTYVIRWNCPASK